MSNIATNIAIEAENSTLNPLDAVPDEMPFDVPSGVLLESDVTDERLAGQRKTRIYFVRI